ncbi:hypothetical protein DPX16_22704 [Anabarilius grahami]|uniref:Uncharacterized protein n=1 Tax=Anabarilius grahami TaxID=495550 RepID=A0A3N0XXE0_ANAGA|nr:hypothetical protein DPX16_22704 [Anabarilius grahami]
MGSQVKLAEEVEKGISLSRSSVTSSSDLLNQDALALPSSDPAENRMLAPSSHEEVDVVEEGKDGVCTEPSQPALHRGSLWMLWSVPQPDWIWHGGERNKKLLRAVSTNVSYQAIIISPP